MDEGYQKFIITGIHKADAYNDRSHLLIGRRIRMKKKNPTVDGCFSGYFCPVRTIYDEKGKKFLSPDNSSFAFAFKLREVK